MSLRRSALVVCLLVLTSAACSDGGAGTTLTVYSGRTQELVEPLFEQFTASTGIELEVRYAGSTDLAATLREETANSPADVFFAQDPASLGAVAEADLFTPLPQEILNLVPDRFSDEAGRWVGTSGRARVVVYDASRISGSDLPGDVYGFASPEWAGRIGIAPSNGSFLAFVAAMIVMDGEDATRNWLNDLAANAPGKYAKNSPIVAAVEGGEIEAGLVNHYYLLRLQAERGDTAATNHFLASGGPGSLIMPAGAGVLGTSDDKAAAEQLIEFLLSAEAQTYFANETFEYPLVSGIPAVPGLPSIETLNAPELDLSKLAGALDVATDLVAAAGLL
jgi:iron(III) transport system substrate-binding protein